VPEDTPHKPANVYGKSKAAAEEVLAKHIEETKDSNKQKLNAIAVRLSNVYGSEYDHPERLIPAIMRNAISSRPIQMVGGDQDVSNLTRPRRSVTDSPSWTWYTSRTLSTAFRSPLRVCTRTRSAGGRRLARLRRSTLARKRPPRP
jgi:hypothetical protein